MSEEGKVEEKKGFTTFDEAKKDEAFNKNLMSWTDGAVSKALLTYKDGEEFNNAVSAGVEKGIADKIEAAKHKTPVEEKVERLELAFNTSQKELATEKLANVRAKNEKLASQGLSDKGYPSGLGRFVVADTEERTLQNLDDMSKVISDLLQGKKTEQLKQNNTKVPSETITTGAQTKLNQTELLKMTSAERTAAIDAGLVEGYGD